MTQEFPDEIIYGNLSEDELENVKSYNKNRQISFLNFNHSDDQSIVGQLTPFAIMREDKIKHVEDCNREVDKKMKKALEIILKEKDQ